ncbi:NAC domain-containing protein 72-like [Malania oleifera]|uniref:NAC domain-containing protein 72-like n=1 Tax=Malania oleifera TaxID=397392 RepID=UPI0025ADAF77|nr:NAC domain-containing protein 72-like [Malania oleifera]
MGDPKNPATAAFISLPPGCRFHPSEEQLLRHYLAGKNNASGGSDCGCDVIKVVDLYDRMPFDLPGTACFAYGNRGRRRHWYCYTARVLKGGRKRSARGGYWKREGRVRNVVGREEKVVLGKRKCFVFYLMDSPKSAARTDWVMHEYALAGHSQAPFVLCRVFVKSCGGNNTSEHVLSSCAEESIGTVRHIGVQHDGFITPDTVEAKTCLNDCVDQKNGDSLCPTQQYGEINGQVAAGSVSGSGFPYSLGIPPNIPVRSMGHISGGAQSVGDMTTKELISILQEDFIELDDLECPLLGVD